MKEVVWIHKELGELDQMDRTKVALDFMAKNILSLNAYTKDELEELGRYFSRELLGVRENMDQTS